MKKTSSTFIIFLTFLVFFLPSVQSEERSGTVKSKGESTILSYSTKYYALIIGNNNYKHLRKLKTAVTDAKSVDKILKNQYGFETRLLIDATRDNILDNVNDFRKTLTEEDSFLIYYAGHGTFEKEADKAYWLPIDAQNDNPTKWIIADDITTSIKRIVSRHILIISDSCYSGTLMRDLSLELSTKGGRDEFIKKMMERKSRTLMASGGNEPVSDSGGGSNSIFAAAFLKALDEADKPLFTAEELFHGRVKEIVAGKSDQVPEYNNIKNSGHEGGDFVFSLKTASLKAGRQELTPDDIVAKGSSLEELEAERRRIEEEKQRITEDRKKLKMEKERQKISEDKAAEIQAQENQPAHQKRFITATDKKTGKIIQFYWDSDKPITDDILDSIFANVPAIERKQSLQRMEKEQLPEFFQKQSISPPLEKEGEEGLKGNEEIFNTAYSDFLKGSFQLAITGFRSYIEKYPDTELAGKSQYWIGECYYSMGEYEKAILEFNEGISR
ncbi:MAG: caspase family protein, partial [Nitrospinae bacterium]|nr:caspase family protein [Nitrospinota bacterium]